ncbi:MAG: hypothetical protein NT049_13650, partial [Planctomycetota bacterium]|nr:hypothetical protein [Planctomycetota bacterium]
MGPKFKARKEQDDIAEPASGQSKSLHGGNATVSVGCSRSRATGCLSTRGLSFPFVLIAVSF